MTKKRVFIAVLSVCLASCGDNDKNDEAADINKESKTNICDCINIDMTKADDELIDQCEKLETAYRNASDEEKSKIEKEAESCVD